jgi:hypothetical protein
MVMQLEYKGFDYTAYYNGGFENANSLPSLVSTGANAIESSMDWGIDPLNNTVYADSNYTDSLAAEGAVIKQAANAGLAVMVKPHIDFLNSSYLGGTPYSVGDWRTYYNPGAPNSAGANAFFASYQSMLVSEADNAAQNGATMFCIGTELDQIAGPGYKSYWDSIINTIRSKDPTLKLTYAADWNNAASPWIYGGSGLSAGTGNLATQISFASELDYFGVDCYAPLSNAASPTLQQLVNGWTQAPVNSGATAETYAVTGGASLISYLEGVAKAVGKPLDFTELGFENASDAASSPANSQTNVENDALQKLLYQSFFQAWIQSGDSTLNGVFLYNWDPNASEVGPGSIAFSPQNLSALSVVDQYYGGPNIVAPSTLNSVLGTKVAVTGVSLTSQGSATSVTATLGVTKGDLFASGGGGTITGSGGATLTLSGTLAQVNAALSTLQYEATASGSDTISIAASAPTSTTTLFSVGVTSSASTPTVSFSTVSNPSLQGGVYYLTVSGTTTASNPPTGVQIYDDGVLYQAAAVDASGNWSASDPLAPNASTEITVLVAQVTDQYGNSAQSSPLMVAVQGGALANFNAANGNVVDLFNSNGVQDVVNGSNGTVVLQSAQANLTGGGDTVYFDGSPSDALSVYGTSGVADLLYGSNGAIVLNGAQASIAGDQNNIAFASGTSGNVVNDSGDNTFIGFTSGDTIDVGAWTYAAGEHMAFVSSASGVQTFALEDAGNSVLANLNFQGYFSQQSFSLNGNGAGGGTAITFFGLKPSPPDASDYYGVGTSDLVWQNQSSGAAYEWRMSSGQHTGDVSLGNLSGWSLVGVGAFNGGSTSDMLWQSQSTGAVYEWTMQNGQHVGDVPLGNLSGWTPTAGDFNGDGTSDVVWENPSSGDTWLWTMNGGQHTADTHLGTPTGWSIVGTGDFTGSGTDDLLWKSNSTGDVYEWSMVNGQHSGDVSLGNLDGFNEIGAGDFNGDGVDDILWQYQATGDVWEWAMNADGTHGNVYLGNLTGWSVEGIGDYTGSGTSDIVWQSQASGATWEWTMSGGQHTGSTSLGNLSGWQGK